VRTRNYKSTLIPGVLILSAQLAIASSGGGIDLKINAACPPGVALCQNQEPPRPISKAPGWPTQPVDEAETQVVQAEEIREKAPLPVTPSQADKLLRRLLERFYQNVPELQISLVEGSEVRVDSENKQFLLGKETLRMLATIDRPISEALSSVMARALAQHIFESNGRADADPKEIDELTRQMVVEIGIPPSAAEQVYEHLSNQ